MNTTTLGRSKNKIGRIVGTSFFSEKKPTFFAVIATKPVEIVFEQKIDNINEVNQNYVMTQCYDCSDTAKKTKDDGSLSLMNGATPVCSGRKHNWY